MLLCWTYYWGSETFNMLQQHRKQCPVNVVDGPCFRQFW